MGRTLGIATLLIVGLAVALMLSTTELKNLKENHPKGPECNITTIVPERINR